MRDPLADLLAIAGPALGDPVEPVAETDMLAALLERRNGFYAFESALHVFHADELIRWNREDLWRSTYGTLAAGHVFFAEDVFGGQFSVFDGAIHLWDPETGAATGLADALAGWAEALLADFAYLTGQPIAHEWQVEHGPLAPGRRLLPRKPFVIGGGYELDNLREADAAEAMRIRGPVAVQLDGLPDGTRVRLSYD